jgi:hypothetical protein
MRAIRLFIDARRADEEAEREVTEGSRPLGGGLPRRTTNGLRATPVPGTDVSLEREEVNRRVPGTRFAVPGT